MREFPLILEASNREEANHWDFGDALLTECGPPSQQGIRDGSRELLKEAAQFLFAKKGRVYSVEYFSGLRSTAHAFPDKDSRLFPVPWTVYHVAGSPEYLKAIIAGAPKGTKITVDYVEGVKRVQAEHVRQEREEENRKAVAAREKAEAEEAAALKKVRDAEEAEKEAALVEAKKASRKAEKAKKKEHDTKVAPRKKAGPPKPEEVPLLVAEMGFLASANRSAALAKKAVKVFQSSLDQLEPKGAKALTSAALEAANAWIEAANTIRGVAGVSQQHGYLSVVGE